MAIHKVLLVDDEPDIRRLAQLSLTAIGKWQVIACATGTEALLLAASEQPDAILMDVMMPVLDGPATLLALRENPLTAHIPVVFMTATGDEDEVTRLCSLGARGVISKPFAPLLLASRLTALVEAP